MGNPIIFPGCNTRYTGNGETVQDMHVFRNRGMVVSQWRLSPEEIEEVVRTGIVHLGVVGHHVPPMIVGSREVVRSLAADFGAVWP